MDAMERLIDGGYHLTHGQISFTRELWDHIGGFQPWRCGADTDFCHKAEKSKGFKHKRLENRAYMLYRETHTQLTSAPSTGMASAYRKTRQDQIERTRREKTWYPGVPLMSEAVRIK